MNKEIWGFNVIGPQGIDARNDFAVGPNEAGDDVILRVNQTQVSGKEFLTLQDFAEHSASGGAIIEQDLNAIGFEPVANTYYQQKSGETPEPTLQAFEIGDVIQLGDKIHFDTTKGAELDAYLASLE